MQHHRLRFVDNGQVEDTAACGGRFGLDPLDLALDRGSQRIEQFIAHLENRIELREIVVLQHRVDFLINATHFLINLLQIGHLFLGHPLMVVVDVVETGPRDVYERFGHLVHVIDDLYIIVPRLDIV